MEARRRALGRGLGALIPLPDHHREQAPGEEVRLIPLEAIEPNPYQPRQVWDREGIQELADSIRQKGLLQPLLVRRVGGTYQIIAGERRFRAAQLAGLSTVPVTVRHAADGESLELALIENLQRENLNPLEEAKAYKRLLEDFGLTQDEVAERVGKSRSAVANSVRLLQLPEEVREQLWNGKLSAGHARSLLALDTPEEQSKAARVIVERRMSVRDAERLARKDVAPEQDLDVAYVQDQLSRALGTRVRIRTKKGGSGQIQVEYYSLAELDGLIARLTNSGR
jgi:ParB family chromosome partitioning protein